MHTWDFPKEHIHWMREQWAKVIFMDEFKFNRLSSDGRLHGRRRTGEEFDRTGTKSTVKFCGRSVIVWGLMSINGDGPIHQIEGKVDQYIN